MELSPEGILPSPRPRRLEYPTGSGDGESLITGQSRPRTVDPDDVFDDVIDDVDVDVVGVLAKHYQN